MLWRKKTKFYNHQTKEIAPDEIFLDSSNLPDFDTDQFEGRLERPIGKRNLVFLGSFFLLIAFIFFGRAWLLQVTHGADYESRSENNHLKHTVVISPRGVIEDRKGVKLAWNEVSTDQADFPLRRYTDLSGFNNLLGYVKYPAKDSSGFYYRDSYLGSDGLEKYYDEKLAGQNGLQITETDAIGNIHSSSVIRPAKGGDTLTTSIDAGVQDQFYKSLSATAKTSGFTGGAGIIMDVKTGEILSMVTYPEYDSNIITNGQDKMAISNYLTDQSNPFLDRAVSGLYTPGSIIKPFLALAALNEHLISPEKQIQSTGSISIPNPYFPDKKSVFNDWRVNGWTNMEEAIAVSSDVYFYAIGGGYQDQKGLGISNIEKYTKLFGFGQNLTNTFFDGPSGTIPSPEWKSKNFNGDPWRIGDTYHTAIGQYGFQISPIQAVRAIAAIANEGSLLQPTILYQGSTTPASIHLPFENSDYYRIVKEGMRKAVTEGTVSALSIPSVEVAGKTGTAELGTAKQYINSWVLGFFPYQNPKYAFVLVMEKGPAHYAAGATAVMRNLFDWMALNTEEYIQ